MLVVKVEMDSFAARSDIETGDIIWSLDGKRIGIVKDFDKAILELEPNKITRIGVARNGRKIILSLKLTK